MWKKIFLFILSVLLFSDSRAQTDSTSSDTLQLVPQKNKATAQRLSVSANPDISVIGDFRTNYQSIFSRKFNAELHEAEFSFQSVVDPYARADFFISLSHNPESEEFGAEIEEGYLTTLSLPAHLQLKTGKFKQTLGKINSIHPHALQFIDMPNAYVRFFGEEGLNDEGFSLSWLVPNHSFFQELTVELTDGPRDNPGFIRSVKNNYLKLVKLKNFWDLTSNATLDLGLTGISGANSSELNTNIAAFDLTYKWKPVQYNTYKSFTFQNEFYYSSANFLTETINSSGWYSLMSLQVCKRWFVTARYDYTHLPVSSKFTEQAASATVGWYATEFQKIEVQGKYTSANEMEEANNFKKNFYSVFFRWIFVIGTHGAHQY